MDRSDTLVRMLPDTCVEEGLRFLGAKMPSLVARKVAHAECHPISHEPTQSSTEKPPLLDRKKRKRFQSPNISDRYHALIPPMHLLERESDFNLEPYEKALVGTRRKPPQTSNQQIYSASSRPPEHQHHQPPAAPVEPMKKSIIPESAVQNVNRKIHTMVQSSGLKSWSAQPEFEYDNEHDELGAKAAAKWDKILGMEMD